MECRHLPPCGGCAYQVGIEKQHEDKRAALRALFGQDIALIPSPQDMAYRSRVDLTIRGGIIGFQQRGKWHALVDIVHCNLISERLNDLLTTVRAWLKGHTDTSLSTLTLRQTRGGQTMVVLRAHKDELALRDLAAALDADTTIVGEATIKGPGYLLETVDGIPFAVGPDTFFQGNVAGAERLFQDALAPAEGSVLDAYCGVGVIALMAAKRGHRVVGVEEAASSVGWARDNAKRSGYDVRFHAQDTKSFLRKDDHHHDTIIVDPPREGLGRDVALLIRKRSPSRLIYISCNPKALKADLSLLGYEADLTAYDLFPHTDHVEMLAILRKNI